MSLRIGESGSIGSIRVREVENCNLFLLSKLRSSTPDILDAENKQLQQRVWNFYIGLLLASTFAPGHKPVMLTGSRRDGEIGVRQQHDLDCPIPCLFYPYPPKNGRTKHESNQHGREQRSQIMSMAVSVLAPASDQQLRCGKRPSRRFQSF